MKTFVQVLVIAPVHFMSRVERVLSKVFVSTGSLGSGFPFTIQVSVTEVPLFAGLVLAVSPVVLSEIKIVIKSSYPPYTVEPYTHRIEKTH